MCKPMMKAAKRFWILCTTFRVWQPAVVSRVPSSDDEIHKAVIAHDVLHWAWQHVARTKYPCNKCQPHKQEAVNCKCRCCYCTAMTSWCTSKIMLLTKCFKAVHPWKVCMSKLRQINLQGQPAAEWLLWMVAWYSQGPNVGTKGQWLGAI